MIIAIANQKGGTGKTTTAVTLAHGMAYMGVRVLLVDMDPQGHVGRALGIGKSPDAGSLLTGAALSDCVIEARPRLDVVRSNALLKQAELRLESRQLGREKALTRALAAGRDYDFVFIDCPPTLGLLTLNALAAARYVMVPVKLEQLSMDGLIELAQTIRAVQAESFDVALGWIVPTMKRHTNEHRRLLSALQTLYGPAVASPIPLAAVLTEAQGAEKTIWEYRRNSPAAHAYFELAGTVIRGLNENLGR